MCGIAGFVGQPLSDTSAEATILHMLERLHHRGPDGQDHWKDPRHDIMLGHTRLAIVDTSDAGRQPMHLNHLHAVVNGEIYNYPELRADLEQRYKAIFHSQCDSEIVLHGYAHEGKAFFARMNGMFAFALYDADAAELMLVRDRAGIKPLYFYPHAKGLVFASEIKALLAATSATKWPIDAEGLCEYLAYQTALNGRTLFKGIALLQPAQMLTVKTALPHEISEIHYAHQVPYADTITDFTEAVGQFEQTFTAGLQRHLLSDVPIASYISAGFDSACVMATASAMLKSQGPMHAFTGRFVNEEGWYDETSVAAQAVLHNSGKHEVVDITVEDFHTSLDAVIHALDEPKMGMGAFSQYMVAQGVASKFKVVLTGHGGDELFAGYPLFKLAEPATLLHLKASQLPHLAYFVLSACRKFFQPEFGRLLPVLWSRRAQKQLLGKKFRSSRPWSSLAALQNSCDSRGERIYETYMQVYLPNLLVVEDKISMAHSLESRTPFLDHQLLDVSRIIAMKTKLHRGQLKAIIKNYAYHLLPSIYFEQPKRGFPTPLRHWLRHQHAGLLEQRLLGPHSGLATIIAPENLAKQVHRYKHSWYRFLRPLDEIQTHRMWQLLSLESWLRQWKDRYGIALYLDESTAS